jgi:carboxymethylenebutenolidase
MIIKDGEYADIPTPTGSMRLHLFRPAAAGRYPGIMLYSEIYQITGPIRRMATFLAGPRFITSSKSPVPCWPTMRPAPIVATSSNS